MAQELIDTGTVANDGTGDTLRAAFTKTNANFSELYSWMSGGGGVADTPEQILAKLLTVDGIGSGLDADLLDGLSSAAFATAVHGHSIADVSGLQVALDAKLASSSYTASDVLTKLLTVDGAGSGLDADLLDGLSSASFATAVHTHAQADVTGLVAALATKLNASSYTAADVLAKLLTVDGAASGLDADLLDGLSSAAFAAASHSHAQSDITGLAASLAAKLDASAYTAADVLTKLLTVDGPASGLNADLLDGFSSADFASAAHSHAIADVTGLQTALDDKLPSASYTAADVLAKLLTVDGTGSGVDADLLDGQSAAAFAASSHSHAIADVTGLQAALDAKGDLSSSASVSVDEELAIYSGTTGKLVKRATGTGLATLTAGVLSITSAATFALASHTHAEADVTGLTASLAAKLDSSAYTAADVLAKLLTVDGAASGLDADLLDGLSSAAFAAASHSHAQSDITGLTAALAAKLDASSYTAADVLAKLLTVDGTGTSLDADLLDGVEGSDYARISVANDFTSGVVTISGATPFFVLNETDQASVNERLWAHLVNGKVYSFSAYTSGFGASRQQIAFTRGTGAAVTAISIGNTSDNATVDFVGTGAVSIGGALSVTGAVTVPNTSFTYAKLQNVSATNRVLGRITAGAGVVEELTGANIATLITYTAADVLSKLLTVDGSGSGLDADLLDGISSASFAVKGASEAINGQWSFTGTQQVFGTTAANVNLVTGLADGGVSMHVEEQIRAHRIGAEPFWQSVRINGSYAAPTAIVNGNSCGEFNFGGYDGSTIQSQSCRIYYTANEDWVAGSAYGGALVFQTTTTGATTRAIRLQLGGNSTGGYALFPSGTAGQPGLAGLSDGDTGIYLSGTNELSISTGGSQRLQINSAGVQATVQLQSIAGTVGAPGVSFAVDTDCGLYRITGNSIALSTAGVLGWGIDAAQRVYGSALHNNASSPTGTTNQYVASGTYTPTLTNTTNVAASTSFQAQWMRVGNVVTVSGRVSVDPTAAGATVLGISLPLASNIGAVEDCAGAAFANAVAGQGAAIWGDATNDRASMEWVAVDTTNQGMSFTFTYEII